MKRDRPQEDEKKGEGREEKEKIHGVDGDEDMDDDEDDEDDYLEEGQDKEGDEDDEEFQWRFGGKIDPLALAEDASGGTQPYQQFERLEYEALAERKRKQMLMEEKKKKKAALFGADMDEIREAAHNAGRSLDPDMASLEEIWDAAGFGFGSRRSRKHRKKQKQRRKVDPAITKKLGEANLLYATSQYDQAIELLKEVVRLAPNMSETYHTLGLIYNSMGNRKKAISFYMLAAHLKPKDVSLWKRLTTWSLEEGFGTGQAIYCLRRATKADPEDILVKWELASILSEIKEYAKAAETYDAILALQPTDVEVCKMAAKMRHKSGRIDEAIHTLEKLIDEHPTEADLTVVNLLADLHMENKDFSSAITCLDEARKLYCAGQGLPLDLAVKAGICHTHLGNEAVAEEYFEALGKEQAEEFPELILQVADVFKELSHHQKAVEYYTLLDGISGFDNKVLWIKMAECYVAVKEYSSASDLYTKAVLQTPDDVELRMTLATLLLKMDKVNEAIKFLTPSGEDSIPEQPWWSDGKLVLLLAKIYNMLGKSELFLETIVPLFRKAVDVEVFNQNIKGGKKRLSRRVLIARAKWLDEAGLRDSFFRINPVLPCDVRAKATRAKKALAKLEAEREERRASVLASGLDWQSDDDSETEKILVDPKPQPLPTLFNEDEHYDILVKMCKSLSIKKRYGEALDIINQTLRISHPNIICRRPELRALGAEITLKARDTKHGYDCVRYIVQQQPYSVSAWNWYYEALSKSEEKLPKHGKFLLSIRNKYSDCVPPMIICGHQFSMISQPQGALREYLQAYRLQPEDPFINLCVGVSLINLSLGFRLTNRNQCVLQGFAFLHKYQQLSENTQESYYNLARAYHHVGFVTIAVHYYEKVLSLYEKGSARLYLSEDSLIMQRCALHKGENAAQGTYDLRREAAYNLHLIYRKSGAHDLARQLLQDYCNP